MSPLSLPQRTAKPRTHGFTAVHDTGIPIGELRNILEDYHNFIDIAKFGVGSAYVNPRLKEKLALYKEFNVTCYFGGTLFEKFCHQGKLDSYLTYLQEVGVSWLEVSNGTLETPLKERVAIVNELKNDFTIVGEVGCKDTEKIMPPSEWIREIQAMLNAGCRYVVTEGRDSGTAGVYRPSGEIRTGLVSDIAAEIDPKRLIFEAPTSKSQMFFINLIGPNVNLGNVSPRDLLLLEAQRVGLRNETFFMEAE